MTVSYVLTEEEKKGMVGQETGAPGMVSEPPAEGQTIAPASWG